MRNSKFLAIFSNCAAVFVSELVGNPEDRFSRDPIHIVMVNDGSLKLRTNFHSQFCIHGIKQLTLQVYTTMKESYTIFGQINPRAYSADQGQSATHS